MPGGHFRSSWSMICFRISLRLCHYQQNLRESLTTDVKYAPTLSSHLCRKLCWVAPMGVYRPVLFIPPGEITPERGLTVLLLVLDFGQVSDPVCASVFSSIK